MLSQINAVEPEQIEGHIGGRARVAEKVIELRTASFVGCDNLTVENCVADIECGRYLPAETDEADHFVAVARDQPAAALLEITDGAEAVVFAIKQPPRVVEWLGMKDGGKGLDARKIQSGRHRAKRIIMFLATSFQAVATLQQPTLVKSPQRVRTWYLHRNCEKIKGKIRQGGGTSLARKRNHHLNASVVLRHSL